MANVHTIATAQAIPSASSFGAYIRAFNFPGDGKPVRTVMLDSGEPGFVGKDVAERLGYVDTAQAIRQHCKGALIQQPLQTAGGTQNVRILTEPDVLRLIISSKLPAAQEFERWVFEDVLPSLRRTGSYTMPIPASAPAGLADKIQCLSLIADGLRLEGSARLGVYQRGLASIAPELLPAVPVYAIDAPAGSGSISVGSEPTASLSDLLKQHGVGKSALAVNKLLASAGLIEQMTRPSSRGADAKFWSVTERGQRWGKNVTSPSNPKETQPHWYVSQFAALMTEIGLRSIAPTIGVQ